MLPTAVFENNNMNKTQTSRRELLERARLKRLNDELLKKEEEERKQRVRQKVCCSLCAVLWISRHCVCEDTPTGMPCTWSAWWSLCFGGRLWWGLQEQEKLAQRAERARLQRLENSMPKAWEQLLWSGEFVPGREEIKQRIQNLPPREQEALLEQYDAHVTQQEKRKSASQVFSAYPDVSEQKVQHLSKPVSILADQSPSAAQMTRSGAQAPVSRAGGSLGTAPETKSYSAQLSDQHIQSLPPLIIAARHSHVNVIQVLLEEGADPNDALDEDGWTPLHYAAGAGNR